MLSLSIPWAVVLAASLGATVTDLRARRIPNLLTLPLLLGGLVWAFSAHGLTGLQHGMLGMLVCGGPFVLLWLKGGTGAGDAKLMLATGAWLGVADGFVAVLSVALAGGLLCIVVLAVQRRDRGTRAEYQPRWQKVPYALAIFAGVCGAALWVQPWAI